MSSNSNCKFSFASIYYALPYGSLQKSTSRNYKRRQITPPLSQLTLPMTYKKSDTVTYVLKHGSTISYPQAQIIPTGHTSVPPASQSSLKHGLELYRQLSVHRYRQYNNFEYFVQIILSSWVSKGITLKKMP